MRGVAKFLSDERGVMTVDFVVWLPLFVSLLVIVTDASMLYMTQTQMWNVARDTVRRMTTRHIESLTEARCWAKAQLAVSSDLTFTVEAGSTLQYNTVHITVPMDDASSFGYFIGPVLGESISARVTMRADPTIKTVLPDEGDCVTDTGGGPGGPGPKK